MITVNLSKIHKMIQDNNSQLKLIIRTELNPKFKYINKFKILEKTTDEDLNEFITQIDERRKKSIHNLDEGIKIIDYIEYLKTKLETLNVETGINHLLDEVKFINRRIDYYNTILSDIKMNSYTDSFERNFKNVDYYKSAFTETNKLYELDILTFIDENIEFLENSIKDYKKKLIKINDDIALKNQTTTTDIMSFDEFVSSK